MVQVDIIEKTGQIAKESGWQTALLIFIIVAGAGFFTWLVRFALTANESSRKEFLAYQRERDKEMTQSFRELTDVIRGLDERRRR